MRHKLLEVFGLLEDQITLKMLIPYFLLFVVFVIVTCANFHNKLLTTQFVLTSKSPLYIFTSSVYACLLQQYSLLSLFSLPTVSVHKFTYCSPSKSIQQYLQFIVWLPCFRYFTDHMKNPNGSPQFKAGKTAASHKIEELSRFSLLCYIQFSCLFLCLLNVLFILWDT